jgi:hypothetical protein
MSVAIDTKALNALVKDLAHAQVAVLMAAKGVVSKGALNIKRDAQSKVLGLKHAPAYPFSIGYDMHSTSTSVYANVGPDKDKRQGALGNLIEYGSVNNAPRPHIAPSVRAELPRFEKSIQDAAAKALGG